MRGGAPYVALGSSFGAGPGLRPRAPRSPRKAGRSARNYAHLLSERLGLALDDRTYSGETVAQIVGADVSRPRGAQLDAVGPDTRLVTLTAGGNDVGYLPRLTLSSLPAPLRLARVVRRVEELGRRERTEDAFAGLRGDLGALCRAIRRRSDAVVVFTDYLTIIPDDRTVDLTPLPSDIAEWGRSVAAELTRVLSDAAAAEGAVFVPVGERSRQHHAWAGIPWTSRFHLTLRGGAAYHPNAAGMAAVAELVADALQPLETELGLAH